MAIEIDSPIARPSASIEPPMMPPRPNGMTTVRIIRQRLPPSASAASFSPGGVCANTSRMTAVAVGVSISATSTPTMNGDAARFVSSGVAKNGTMPRLSASHSATPEQVRLQEEEAPDAVDQAGHGGQQVEHGHQRPLRRSVAGPTVDLPYSCRTTKRQGAKKQAQNSYNTLPKTGELHQKRRGYTCA